MMRRARLVSIGSAVIAVLLGWLAASSPAAFADTDSTQGMDVIVVDSSSVRESGQAIPLTLSLIGLLATQQDGSKVVFIDTDGPGEAIGPFAASDSDFANIRSEILARLNADSSYEPQSIVEALDEARSTLSTYGAPAGSSIYVALGGGNDFAFDELSYTVAPLVNRIATHGWTVNGLSLHAGDQRSVQFLDAISRPTGGSVFSLSSGVDLKPLGDHIIGFGAAGSVEEFASKTLVDAPLTSSRIPIMPGTEETTLYFYKESPGGSFQLVNPLGELVPNVDGVTSQVVESDNLAIWRLVNPVAGNWKVETVEVEGRISVWGHAADQYDLILRTPSPMPTGEPNTLLAYLAQDGRTAVLKGVRVFANITSPDSSTTSYELFDNGTRGDSKAGDGYYSVILPPLEMAGSYAVTLNARWLGFNYEIASNHALEARPFPAFHVETGQVRDLVPGEATNIGTVSVHLDGGPYSIDPSDIEIGLATSTEKSGMLELVPHRLYGDGSAWQFDMLFTPSDFGSETLQFSLSIEYGGRTFTEPSSSIAISTVASESPPVSIVPAAVESQPAPAAPAPAAASNVPVAGVAVPPAPQAAFPWLVVAILVAVAVPIAAGVVYFLTRPKPYGYIYTESDDELVDFSNLERHPIFRFFYRGLIRGSELNIPGFEGLVFHFMKDRIDIKSFGEHSTVRVNNQPLIDSATISDKTWIGTEGKLYTFLNSPPPVEPAGAD
ncbi:MAG: hypothetical protein F4X72_05110 [Dehalococcoidia bacterium]|nr:hypothetical protein [Dehalococcoidia bacterium]